jgi:ribosome-associated heat shock protein Hsp15
MAATNPEAAVRLDKWLWWARAARTRTLAQKMVVAGKARIDGVKTRDPARLLRVGNVVTLSLPRGVVVWRVAATGERRGPAREAASLYVEISGPAARLPSSRPPV